MGVKGKLVVALAVAAAGIIVAASQPDSTAVDQMPKLVQTNQNPFRNLRVATPEQAAALPVSQGFELN